MQLSPLRQTAIAMDFPPLLLHLVPPVLRMSCFYDCDTTAWLHNTFLYITHPDLRI